MSFTAPLWNELVFEKINELHASHQEVMKHLSQLSIRIIHLENRMANISNGVGHLFTHFQNRKPQTMNELPNMNTHVIAQTTQQPIHVPQIPSVLPESLNPNVHDGSRMESTIGLPKESSVELTDEMEKYSDDHDEGEWTKVSRKRK